MQQHGINLISRNLICVISSVDNELRQLIPISRRRRSFKQPEKLFVIFSIEKTYRSFDLIALLDALFPAGRFISNTPKIAADPSNLKFNAQGDNSSLGALLIAPDDSLVTGFEDTYQLARGGILK